jgi:undecaprenyl-diphosphatase
MEHLVSELIEQVVRIDEATMEFLVEFRGPGLTKLMASVTGLGSATAALVFLILFHLAGWREEVIVTGIALAIMGVVVGTFMMTIERPFPANPVCLTESSESVASSFPSGHAAAICTYAMTARHSDQLPFGLVSFLAGLVSFSRLYLGTHYLSDTVAGVLIGILAFLVAKRIVDRYDEVELVQEYLDGGHDDGAREA